MVGVFQCLKLLKIVSFICLALLSSVHGLGEQPLSKIDIYKTTLALRDSASAKASPILLGLKVMLFDSLLLCLNIYVFFNR